MGRIIDAEKTAFFKGAIRFLYHDGDGNVNWKDFNSQETFSISEKIL